MLRPTCGTEAQCAHDGNSPSIGDKRVRCLQRAIGKFLRCAPAIGNAAPRALGSVARAVTKGTEATEKAVQHSMDCAHCDPDAEVEHRASNVIIQADSGAACLVEPDARSRAGGFHFLGWKNHTQFSGPIHVLAKTIKSVRASAVEAVMKLCS